MLGVRYSEHNSVFIFMDCLSQSPVKKSKTKLDFMSNCLRKKL